MLSKSGPMCQAAGHGACPLCLRLSELAGLGQLAYGRIIITDSCKRHLSDPLVQTVAAEALPKPVPQRFGLIGTVMALTLKLSGFPPLIYHCRNFGINSRFISKRKSLPLQP